MCLSLGSSSSLLTNKIQTLQISVTLKRPLHYLKWLYCICRTWVKRFESRHLLSIVTLILIVKCNSRQLVSLLLLEYRVSERRACATVRLHRTGYRYLVVV